MENNEGNKWWLGAEGEKVMNQWLVSDGYSILPASYINMGGAPLLLENNYKAILPDTLTWKNFRPRWIEIKTKSNSTHHDTPPVRDEHGIPLRHWTAYEFVQQKTQTPVTLAIIELSTSSLLMATLDELKSTERIYPMARELHIFFNRNSFHKQSLFGIKLPESITPSAPRTIAQQQKTRLI